MATLIEMARKMRPLIVKAAQSLTDEEAVQAPYLYDEWSGDGVTYAKNTRIRRNGKVYKVITTHTSQADWPPDVAPSLYAKVLIPDADKICGWEQPDSTNPYMSGDKVTHNGKTWESTCDNNVWEPGVYGWVEII